MTASNTPSVFLSDPDVTLHHGDVSEALRELPAESVDCVVTSPPYWGLRDYGTGAWEGGDAECDHLKPVGGVGAGSLAAVASGKKSPEGARRSQEAQRTPYFDICGKCGATRIDQQLGLEPTPEQYVERMVEVFREVRRVLAAHGTCWLNLGDSYNAGRSGGWAGGKGSLNEGRDLDAIYQNRSGANVAELKPKDLVGIPWRTAFALQADGWYLRSDIIWSKPNPMPESVTDRPTKAHEYVFLLSKQPRYFFDQEAVREAYKYDGRKVTTVQGKDGSIQHRNGERWPGIGKNSHAARASLISHGHDENEPMEINHAGRNIRSVWEIATQPFSGRELFGGDGRISSPDCPRHGDRPAPAPTGRRGGRADASASRTPRSDGSLAQESQDGPVPTEPSHELDSALASSDSLHHASTATAIPSSTRTRKTSSHSDERDTDAEQTPDHTRHSEPSDGLLELDGFDSHGSSETSDRTSRKSGLTGGAYSPPGQAPHGNARDRDLPCTCKYIDHFATFPEELARRAIAAGTSERGKCPECGAPWVRKVEQSSYPRDATSHRGRSDWADGSGRNDGDITRSGQEFNRWRAENPGTMTWVRTCASSCVNGGKFRTANPCVVLDPFMGSGTVAYVARKLGRHSIGIDLSAEYLALAARRLQQQSLFAEAASGL